MKKAIPYIFVLLAVALIFGLGRWTKKCPVADTSEIDHYIEENYRLNQIIEMAEKSDSLAQAETDRIDIIIDKIPKNVQKLRKVPIDRRTVVYDSLVRSNATRSRERYPDPR